MTPQELKNSILQLAIQGKLVEQRPEEMPISLDGLKNKKTEDYEFDLPKRWILGHIETITDSISTKKYQILESQVRKEGAYPVISQSKDYSIGFSDSTEKLFSHDMPVIIFGDHTTVVKLVDFDFIVGADGVKIFAPLQGIVLADFLYYVLQFLTYGLDKVGGYSRHYKYIKDKAIPLPPLAEQKRIVAKIEELLPLIDRYEEAWAKLEEFNRRFPGDMQKSLLQMAIQGKLVEQRPEEGNGEELYSQIQAEKQALIKSGKIKKDKPLPEITEDEKSFDIPESWMWVRLGDTFAIEMGQSPDGNSVSEFTDGMEFHQGKVFFGEKLLNQSPQKTSMLTKIAPPNSVLLCVRAPVGKVNITDREICIGRGLCSVSAIAGVPTDFVYYLLTTYENIFIKQATGTTFVAITGAVVKNQAIPLPPLAEQKRIVAKLEELLPLCERLK